MIAVSSFKEFGESDEVTRNQIEANRSWNGVFESIVYFNSYDSRLSSPNTVFIPSEPFPKIRDISKYCASIDGWSCIINADIIVTPALVFAERELDRHQAQTATSRRWNFEFGTDRNKAKLTDLGLDIFIARPGTWKEISELIPIELRMGHCLWDTWVAGYFSLTGSYYDITPFRCIYHVNHKYRNRPHSIPIELKSNKFVRAANFPRQQLNHAAVVEK